MKQISYVVLLLWVGVTQLSAQEQVEMPFTLVSSAGEPTLEGKVVLILKEGIERSGADYKITSKLSIQARMDFTGFNEIKEVGGNFYLHNSDHLISDGPTWFKTAGSVRNYILAQTNPLPKSFNFSLQFTSGRSSYTMETVTKWFRMPKVPDPPPIPEEEPYEKAWRIAKEKDVIPTYKYYIAQYCNANASNCQRAKQRVLELEEEEEVRTAWEEAKKIDRKEAYEGFDLEYCKKEKSGYYCKEAQKEILSLTPIAFEPLEQSGSIYSYYISELSSSTLSRKDISFDTSAIRFVSIRKRDQGFELQLESIPRRAPYVFEICDTNKRQEVRCKTIDLGSDLVYELLTDDPALFQLTISEGESPYILQFVDTLNGGKPSFTLSASRIPIHWTRDSTAAGENWKIFRNKLAPGYYHKVVLRDNNNITKIIATDFEVTTPPPPISKEALLAGLGALLLFIGILSLSRRRKAKKAEAKREEMRQVKGEKKKKEEEDKTGDTDQKVAKEEPSESANLQLKGTTLGAARSGNSSSISIKQRSDTGKRKHFSYLLDPGAFLPLEMSKLWKDTVVDKIYLHRSTIHDLDQFLRDYNTSKIQEQESGIPEIGGMLMGTYDKQGAKYQVTVDHFIPIQAQFQNVYQLEFSAESISKDLSVIQDEHPNLQLVGWFHTHPGHGLFLSKPDLRIQEGFFRQPYQFAMEIDSLSENLDTGFFTWQQDGNINNTERSLAEAKWFSWTELEKFTRKR